MANIKRGICFSLKELKENIVFCQNSIDVVSGGLPGRKDKEIKIHCNTMGEEILPVPEPRTLL